MCERAFAAAASAAVTASRQLSAHGNTGPRRQSPGSSRKRKFEPTSKDDGDVGEGDGDVAHGDGEVQRRRGVEPHPGLARDRLQDVLQPLVIRICLFKGAVRVCVVSKDLDM